MEKCEKVERFTSCRGVAFEIKSHSNLFAITTPPIQSDDQTRHILMKSSWFPWRTSSRVLPTVSNSLRRSVSRPSSHFCDLDHDEDEYDDEEEELDHDHHVMNTVLEDGLIKDHQLETKLSRSKREKPKNSRLSIILLDQGLFTVYKRLFLVSLIINIVGLVLAATGHFPYARQRATLFSIGNILALTLCRSEVFLRVVFWLAVKLFGHSWVPLRIKTAITSLLQSIGGIHSGCGVSSIAWLVYSLILTLNDRQNTSSGIIVVASIILSLLCLSSLAAFPLVRHLHHNVFERTHRFAGWTALFLLWLFIVLTTSYDQQTKSYANHIGSRLLKKQEFWLTTVISVLIITPWITVRRVPVQVSSASGHASIIKFEGGVKAGILGRISPSPLSEWHAFGIISDGKTGHMMLAGAVGDFTKSLVADLPTHLWVRKVHFAGLPYLTNMYDRVLLVATGSGICVFLSFLLQESKAEVCLLWVTKGVEENFGREVKEMVSGWPEGKVIVHDTAAMGRPDVSKMSVEAARKWGAEVVLVTSNPQGSRDVVNACKASGIPAFGPVWDS
ncbi:adenylate-forming reductase 06235 [Impatiens glandulifera]|uniref:adenylate-forming reductase 06235 n=1 Tax=Impatiens glandulifera TaxID=253017 RepID=UPI001FB05140|nr:adenylate-forming reductase 06235 [Impatiens glandulifera]